MTANIEFQFSYCHHRSNHKQLIIIQTQARQVLDSANSDKPITLAQQLVSTYKTRLLLPCQPYAKV